MVYFPSFSDFVDEGIRREARIVNNAGRVLFDFESVDLAEPVEPVTELQNWFIRIFGLDGVPGSCCAVEYTTRGALLAVEVVVWGEEKGAYET